jgi:hypothetical protein
MTVYGLARFTIDPADAAELLTWRAALVAVSRNAFRELIESGYRPSVGHPMSRGGMLARQGHHLAFAEVVDGR